MVRAPCSLLIRHSPSAGSRPVFKTVEAAHFTHQPIELWRVHGLRTEEPSLQQRIRQRQEALEVRQAIQRHSGQVRIRIPPDQMIHFLGAPMHGSIERPAAARLDVVRHVL